MRALPWAIVAGVLLGSVPAEAQSEAACSLAAGSHAEATLSPPTGEDEAFLGRAGTGGLPYIAFVIDTSEWMRKFPIDLTSPEVRANGLGCNNTILNALTYQANPCIDGKGALLDSKILPAQCNKTTAEPAGFGQNYSSSQTYVPYDVDLSGLFDRTRFYVHDRGWGSNSLNVDGAWVKNTATDACTIAGVPTGSLSTCSSCLATRGYYLPTDPTVPPVLSGNWMNFNPPKFVIARKVLKDQFAALDGPSRTRQTMLTVVNTHADRCFSRNLGSTGMDAGPKKNDPDRDGARLIGNPTQFKPPCGQFTSCLHNGSSGGGRAAFDNEVNKEAALFTSPNGGTCPSKVDLPSEAPPGTTAVRFTKGPDSVCTAAFVDALNQPLGPAACAPYAEALLNAGQYLGDLNLYDSLFPNKPSGTWRKDDFNDDDGVCPAASCGCPKPVVILLAGGAPGFDDNLPCEITGNGCAASVPAPACNVIKSPSANSNLAKVARFLANANIKPKEYFNSPAHVYTHVVAFGTDHPDLLEAANAGKGRYFTANNAQQLRSALNEAIAAASTTQYSFSSASISAVQTRTTNGLLVPRFTPSDSEAFWAGRLYQFQTVNEDTCGCVEPVATGDPCDFNRDGQCGGVFFKDAAGDFIAADANGIFRKAGLVNGEFRPGVIEAVPKWEAAKRLEAKTAATGKTNSRRVLTVVDSSGDGLLDHRDQVISFDESNVSTLLPYLNAGPGSFCEELSQRTNTCLDAETCATKVIQFVRGMDVLDQDCDGDFTEDRPNKLGDIFHASPVLVDPPMSTQSVLCRLGLHAQCLVSLTQTPTKQDAAGGYEDYVSLWSRRDKVVLVGANDGMLHAFRGGRWVAEDNPDTAGLDECPTPGTNCTGYYDVGDGEELWAFISPDLLPKLGRMMLGQHQYYVDGTAMVRDIWADEDGDARKDADEFHTVAIVGERRGGTHFFALDVTRPEGPERVPSTGFFRWVYPQPNTAAARSAGQSYAEFMPIPPPIGPVRVKAAGSAKTGTWRGEDYEERWVVLLNGGFDPGLVRGRTISMVDVWRGGDGTSADQALWTFDAGASGHSFAATPGMVGFGPNSTNPNRDPNEFFFDTATVGDVGGQLWTLRFNHPDPAKWSGARSFQADDSGGMCAQQPFFQITANAVAMQGGHLRTLVGTGDRFNVADEAGGRCSLNNLVGCLRRGCTLTQQVTRTVCGRTSTWRREYDGSNSSDTCDLSVNTLPTDVQAGSACCSSGVDVRADYTLRCTNSDNSPVTIRWQPQVTCSPSTGVVCGSSETQFVCDVQNDTPFDVCGTFDRCAEPITPPPNGFYSVKVFEDTRPQRTVFDDPTAAATYDGAALTTDDLVQVDPYTPSNAQATATDPGWYLSYGQPDPPGHVFPQVPAAFFGNAVNERTTTPALVVGGCSVVTTSTPGGAVGACQPRAIVANTTYYLHFLTGGPCTGLDSALASRISHRQETEPPSPPQLAMDVTPAGSVNIKLTGISRSSGGAAHTTPVVNDLELVKVGYRIPVTRPLHACRHPEGATTADQRAAAQVSCEVR